MIEPIIGRKYVIHLSSGNKVMTFIGPIVRETMRIYSRVHPEYPPVIHRGYTHYEFKNERTGRNVIIKSRLKIRLEV